MNKSPAIILLTFVTRLLGQELASSLADQNSLGNSANGLLERAADMAPFNANLDKTTLGKTAQANLARSASAVHKGMAPVHTKASLRLSTMAKALSDPRPVQIIPSVLPADWANMGQCVKDLEAAGVDRIQFDVMDGNFVPNLTFGPELIAACRKYCKTPFETQLMVTNYNSDTMLEEYVKATKGPNGEPGVVIVHVEACTHLHRTLAKIRALGGSPSVAMNPHTPFESIKNVLDMVDHVLVMTVNPGFGGQAYIPTMINKIKELRAAIVAGGFDVDIEVDGGIKADWTLSECAAAGANCFIAGSGMFAYPTLKEGCDALRQVAVDAQNGKLLEKP